MPYIAKEAREKFLHDIYSLSSSIKTPGELNFVITKLALNYARRHKLSYHTLNELIGVLECVKLEFYRRLVSSYEDTKSSQNGEIFSDTDEEGALTLGGEVYTS